MSTEKSDALVIRQADFSESSRVVTFFTRDFGKISCLAKGAKRQRNAFDGALDLLAECRVVFIHKQSTGLDLLTEAQLLNRFHPIPTSLPHLYAGYYVAELLAGLTEDRDPHPMLYDAATRTLSLLSHPISPHVALFQFELKLLQETGHLPDFDTCTICQSPISLGEPSRFWVSQTGLICSQCGHSEYEHTTIQSGAIAVIRKLLDGDDQAVGRLMISERQRKDIRRILTAVISSLLGRIPKTLKLLGS